MMKLMKVGGKLLARTSPWGLIAAGAVFALTLPAARKGLRYAAVTTTRGVLGVLDYAKTLSLHMQEQVEDIVAEARSGEPFDITEDWERAFTSARSYPHDLAVSAATAGLAVSEQVGRHARTVKRHVKGIVEEAKTRHRARITSPVNNLEPTNEPASETTNVAAESREDV